MNKAKKFEIRELEIAKKEAVEKYRQEGVSEANIEAYQAERIKPVNNLTDEQMKDVKDVLRKYYPNIWSIYIK